MAANKKAIKERIRSIRSTKKITSAMEVIANAKLAKQRSVMEKNRAYSDIIQDTIASIMASDIEIDSAFLNAKSSSNTYYLIFGSDLGLCGAYNMNAIKELEDIYEDGDKVIVFGTKIAPLLKKDGKEVAIVEGLKLASVDKAYIKEHIDKAIVNYNPLGTSTFIIAYADAVDFAGLWNRLYSYLTSYEYPIEVKRELKELVQTSAAIKCAEILLNKDTFVFPLYFLAVNIGR